MRLINADALKEYIYENFYGIQCYDGSGDDIIAEVNDIIDNTPTVEERPQGEWIREDEVYSKCSLCSFKYADYRILFDYCPNCGASMQKGGAE